MQWKAGARLIARYCGAMSQENVELVRESYERFQATGEFDPELVAPEFVWDMSTFRGWPGQQEYRGVEGARQFLDEWLEAWDDWELSLEDLHDAGGQIVAIVRQQGRSKAAGLPVDMTFAQMFTLRDGKQVRMQMYAQPSEALQAAGLSG
jgi:ketosteroid isomerase-like protein